MHNGHLTCSAIIYFTVHIGLFIKAYVAALDT